MKFFQKSSTKKQVWGQIKRFGGWFGRRDVGFKKRVAILGPINFRSMVGTIWSVASMQKSLRPPNVVALLAA